MKLRERYQNWCNKRAEERARRQREADQAYDELVFGMAREMLQEGGAKEILDDAIKARKEKRDAGEDVPVWGD